MEDEIPLEMAPSAVSGRVPSRAETPMADDEFEDSAGLPGFNLNFGGDGATFSFAGGSSDDSLEEEEEDDTPPNDGVEDPFARIAELMGGNVEPIPDVFASPPPKPAPRRKGAAGLWVLVLLIVVGSIAGGLYGLQDKVVDYLPVAATAYEELGLRNEVVGAGLIFRNYNSERMVQDNSEVLIVRGVIANTTDQPRDIPLLRLALYNDKALLQKKIISPPQTSLDARATVGFRITLEQPDASASRFEVTFTNAKGPDEEVAPH